MLVDQTECSLKVDVNETPRLLIVIVNYRSADLTIQCLESLQPEVEPLKGCQIVVVENASGEAAILKAAIASRRWDSWCSLVESRENRGFAAGNNVAIAPALAQDCLPEYILLLNPDTIVRPGALLALLQFMETHPACGIAGSRLEERDGTVQCSAFRFPSALGEFENGAQTGPISRVLHKFVVAPPAPETNHQVDWVSGASLMVRREVFSEVGLLDDGFFMYYEEVDFCKRVRNAGWECWYIPESRVVHLVGKSSGFMDPVAAPCRRPAYWFASRRRYFVRNYGPFGALLADMAWLAGTCIHLARCAIERRPIGLPPYFIKDFIFTSLWGRTGDLIAQSSKTASG